MRKPIPDSKEMITGYVLILIHNHIYKNLGDKTRREIYNSQDLTESYIISFTGT